MLHNPLANLGNGHIFHLVVLTAVHAVNLNSGYLVFFVRYNRVFGDVGNGKLAENDLCGDFLGNGFWCDTKVSVTGFRLVCLCENVFDITEFKSFSVKSGFKFQCSILLSFLYQRNKCLLNLPSFHFEFFSESIYVNCLPSGQQHTNYSMKSKLTSVPSEEDFISTSPLSFSFTMVFTMSKPMPFFVATSV